MVHHAGFSILTTGTAPGLVVGFVAVALVHAGLGGGKRALEPTQGPTAPGLPVRLWKRQSLGLGGGQQPRSLRWLMRCASTSRDHATCPPRLAPPPSAAATAAGPVLAAAPIAIAAPVATTAPVSNAAPVVTTAPMLATAPVATAVHSRAAPTTDV